MKANNTLLRLLVALGLSVSATLAQAVVTIDVDTFENAGNVWPLIAYESDPQDDNNDSGLGGVIGGTRHGIAVWIDGEGEVEATVFDGSYEFGYFTPPPAAGTGVLQYNAGQAGLNLDLLHYSSSGLTNLEQSFFNIDVSSSYSGNLIKVTLTDINGNSIGASVDADGVGTISIPLSIFHTLELSNIFSISAEFSNFDEQDPEPLSSGPIVIDSLSFSLTESIPEPATLALFGLGLAGLPFVRKRKAA